MKQFSSNPNVDTLRNICFSNVTLTEQAYPAVTQLPKHGHEQAYFCFVLSGNFTEVYGNRPHSCCPSTLIFDPRGEIHSDQFHTSTRCFNIQMNCRWLERIGRGPGQIKAPAFFHGGRSTHLAFQLYREFLEVDEFSPLLVEGLTLEIIGDVSRHLVNELRLSPPTLVETSERDCLPTVQP